MSDHKDMTNRHLRHKLQSLGRRLDELEEATNKLQKSEDELLDLQDKIIQAEGSNSSLLGDVEALRKRLLKIQGKDEEVRKAEDLCRIVREKLEEEENLTKELKTEIERLQKRMAELEKLEEAFGKSKSDCSQLCLSLNEEKNLTKKLSSELEALKARMKEVEGSEAKLDKAEQALAAELEKLKSFTQTFVSERKRLLEKQREDEKIILKLTEKSEHQKNRLSNVGEPGRADVMRARIEDELSSPGLLTSKLAGRKKSLDYLKLADDKIGLRNKSENEKNSLEGPPEEDNKVKELTQEVERLKCRLKQLEIIEEDFKNSESKNGELQEKFQIERNRARQLNEQVEQLKTQLRGNIVAGNVSNHGNGSPNLCPNSPAKVLENGKAENEEINVRGGFRPEKPKNRNTATVSEMSSPKFKRRDLSPQQKRETKLKELSHSEESSPKTARRAVSPAHKTRRAPKTTTPSTALDNGVRDTGRGAEDKLRGVTHRSANTFSSDSKKVSVLSRYPPAANDHKPWKSTQKQGEGESKKIRAEKISKQYVGSDSESNSSDVVPDSSSNISVSSAAPPSDLVSLDQVPDSVSLAAGSAACLSKANGSYTAYRSFVTPLLPCDQGSEGHSSASETESTGSRPSEPEPVTELATTSISSRTTNPKYSRYTRIHDSNSEGSSSRSSFDEEFHNKPHLAEGGSQESSHTPSGMEIRRVCSPREALWSKAVIKPAIVEIDRKEVMMSEPTATNGKPKISTKPVLTSTNKMTSSITIYPNDPSSSRTSSRSSSVSSEPAPVKERHTSTSNIVIGPSSDHRGSISIPYEISIPKSEITVRPYVDQGCGLEDQEEPSSGSSLHESSHLGTPATHRRSQNSSLSLASPDTISPELNNDTESGFESSSSSTTTVTSWRSHSIGHPPQEEKLPDMRNVTVRSTWKNRGDVDDTAHRGGGGALKTGLDGGSEDDTETATTWRAYRATATLDAEESVNSRPGGGGNAMAQKGVKPSPAEVYMRRINSVVTSTREIQEPGSRRSKHPTDVGGLGRTIPHEPVTSQSWSRSHIPPTATGSAEPGSAPSSASWRRQAQGSESNQPGSSYERGARSTAGSSRGGELWSSRGHGAAGRPDGKTGAGNRPWSQRPPEHH